MGSVVILITILARFLLRNRSKRFIMILWAVVALRLIVPFGFESAFSIFNYLPLPTQAAPAIEEVSEAALPDNNSGAYEAPVNYAEFNNADAPAAAEVPGDIPGRAVVLRIVKTCTVAEMRIFHAQLRRALIHLFHESLFRPVQIMGKGQTAFRA